MALKDIWVDKVDGQDDVVAKDINDIAHSVVDVENTKVDKEEGKGLSSNDFTNTDKEKLDNLPTKAENNEFYASKTELNDTKENLENKITELGYKISDDIAETKNSLQEEIEENAENSENLVSELQKNTEQALLDSKKEANDLYANALKSNVSGSFVSVNDISPVEHTVKTKVSSKNLIPFPYYTDVCTFTRNDLTITIQDDGGVLIDGTPTQETYITLCIIDFGELNITPKSTFGMITNSNGSGVSTHYNANNKNTFVNVVAGRTYDNVLFYPQMEYGYKSTSYTPYVDVSAVALTTSGKNLFNPNAETQKVPNEYYTGVDITDLVKTDLPLYLSMTLKEGKTLPDINYFGVAWIVGYSVSAQWYIQNRKQNYTSAKLTIPKNAERIGIVAMSQTAWNTVMDAFDVQLEIGSTATEFEPFNKIAAYTPNADGSVDGVKSISPSMSLISDTAGIVIEAEYNKDINKVVENLTNAIISLGGNV